jgi:hypothetical protein
LYEGTREALKAREGMAVDAVSIELLSRSIPYNREKVQGILMILV